MAAGSWQLGDGEHLESRGIEAGQQHGQSVGSRWHWQMAELNGQYGVHVARKCAGVQRDEGHLLGTSEASSQISTADA